MRKIQRVIWAHLYVLCERRYSVCVAVLSVHGIAGITVPDIGLMKKHCLQSIAHKHIQHPKSTRHRQAPFLKNLPNNPLPFREDIFSFFFSDSPSPFHLIFFSLASFKRLPLAGHPFLLLLLILIFFNGKKYTYIILNPLTKFIVYLSRTTSTLNAEQKRVSERSPVPPTHLHLPPSLSSTSTLSSL